MNLSSIPGRQELGDIFGDMKEKILAEVTARARAGAEEAIPKIKQEVETTVRPYVYASIGAAVLSLFVAIAAYNRAGN
jgi:hypothetical protein